MQHNAAFHQGLHCWLRLKQPSGTKIHHNLETPICDPLEYKMDSPLLIVSVCMGKSIRLQRVKSLRQKMNLKLLSRNSNDLVFHTNRQNHINIKHARIQPEGSGLPPAFLKNHRALIFLLKTGPDPWKTQHSMLGHRSARNFEILSEVQAWRL